jgi:hypothetical protein
MGNQNYVTLYLSKNNNSDNSGIVQVLTSALGTSTNCVNTFEYTGETTICYYVRLYITSGTITKGEAFLQLQQGTTASSYTEHKEQTYTIPVQQEMRDIKDSNGNVIAKDEFIEKDGVKYERHNVARVVFDGTENWIYSSSLGTMYISNFGQGKTNNDIVVASNKYFATSRNNYNVSNQTININQLGILSIYDTDFDNVEDFKSSLAEQYANGTPVYVDYILATPQDLPCTQAQIDVLEDLPSTYLEQTNVLSEDNVPANVKASGYLDLNSLVTRVAQLETEV